MNSYLKNEVINFLVDRANEAKENGKSCVIVNRDVENNPDVINDYYSKSTLQHINEKGMDMRIVCYPIGKQVTTEFGQVTVNKMEYNIELYW